MRKSVALATQLHGRQIEAALEAPAAVAAIQEKAARGAAAAAADLAAAAAKRRKAAAAAIAAAVAIAAAGGMVEGEASARMNPREGGAAVFRLWPSCRTAAPVAPSTAELRHIRLVMAQVACGDMGPGLTLVHCSLRPGR